jgi:glucosamine-6-phosphate deaminase
LIQVRSTIHQPLIEPGDPAELAERVAALLIHERRCRPERPLGLATGRTMEPIYRALARQLQALQPPERTALRERWLSFNLDEYVGISPTDPRSFTAFMAGWLLEPLELAPEQVRLPDGLSADPAAEAKRYGAAVAAAGGIGLQLLGLGRNGHVAFNEPPSSVDAPCRVVRLCDSTRQHNAPGQQGGHEMPELAITLGLAEILAADRILLVVIGSAKAEVLGRALREHPSPELPASWLQLHPAVTLFADREALRDL